MPISPSFPFFPSDYLGDPHTIVMSTEETGAYCLLLWVCWEQEGLPTDVDELAGYARLPLKRFQPMWEKRIKRCFIFDEKRNQFLHPRFEKIIREIKAFRKQKSKAGKVSGQKRRERKELDAEQVLDSVDVLFEQNANKNEPSFSSSSSISIEEEEVCDAGARTFAETVIDGIKTELNILQLSKESDWLIEIERAEKNQFSADHCIETFQLMNRQTWRAGPIKPATWTENLPILHKLRTETERKNGKNKQPSEREKSASRTINAERMAAAIAEGDDDTLRSILGMDGQDRVKGYLPS